MNDFQLSLTNCFHFHYNPVFDNTIFNGYFTIDMKRQFNILKKHYGSHRKAANALGIHEVHYQRIRAGRHEGSKLFRLALKLLAEKVKK